ncbi:MAG: hypothetical protein OEW12_05925 [Deltaproteobacteria bacterium]|nr:hypothetical protein [Deltaproteobacteria bacterium]
MEDIYLATARAIFLRMEEFRKRLDQDALAMILKDAQTLLDEIPDIFEVAARLKHALSEVGLDVYHNAAENQVDLHLNDFPLVVLQFMETTCGPTVFISR